MDKDKNRSHGKIDDMPDEIRREVESKLIAGETYQAVADYLGGKGYEIHFTSVWRYGNKYVKKFEDVRTARNFAQILAEDNALRPSTEMQEANNALLSQLIMEILLDDKITPEKKMKLAGKAVASLQHAQTSNERAKIVSREKAGAVQTAMRILRNRVFEVIGEKHPEIADIIMGIADEVEQENTVV
jgi:hypothetical protein